MLTQSPANHKINFQVKRASSLLESYPGVAVQVQGEGRGGKGGEERVVREKTTTTVKVITL